MVFFDPFNCDSSGSDESVVTCRREYCLTSVAMRFGESLCFVEEQAESTLDQSESSFPAVGKMTVLLYSSLLPMLSWSENVVMMTLLFVMLELKGELQGSKMILRDENDGYKERG